MEAEKEIRQPYFPLLILSDVESMKTLKLYLAVGIFVRFPVYSLVCINAESLFKKMGSDYFHSRRPTFSVEVKIKSEYADKYFVPLLRLSDVETLSRCAKLNSSHDHPQTLL